MCWLLGYASEPYDITIGSRSVMAVRNQYLQDIIQHHADKAASIPNYVYIL